MLRFTVVVITRTAAILDSPGGAGQAGDEGSGPPLLPPADPNLRTGIEQMPDGYAVLQSVRAADEIVDFRWAYINPAGAATLQRSPADLAGRCLSTIFPNFHDSGMLAAFRLVVDTGERWASADVTYEEGGGKTIFDTRAWKDGDGLALSWRDVTRAHEAQAALRASHEQFQTTIQYLPDSVSVFSAIRNDAGQIIDFHWTFANPASAAITGFAAEDLVGRTLLEVLPDHGPSGMLEVYSRVVETGEPHVNETLWYEDTWGDGNRKRRAFDIRATRVNDGFVVVTRDVTELRLATEELIRHRLALERSNARIALNEAELRAVLNTLTDGVQVYGADGTLEARNPAAARIYELYEDEPTITAVLKKWEMLREDGAPLEISDSPLARAMLSGTASVADVVGIRRRADGVVRWLSVTVVPVRDSGGVISAYVSCASEITDRIMMFRGLRILNTAAERLSSSLVSEDVLTALTEAAAELCSLPGEPPRRAVLLVVEREMLTMDGLSDPSERALPAHDRVAIRDHPFASQVIDSGQPLVARFTDDDFGPSASRIVRNAGIRNGALVPLTREGRVFAVLAVSGKQESIMSAGSLEHLSTLATTGTLALSNADAHRLVESLTRIDPLTGAANRRAFDDRLAQLARTSFALVAADVDHLKALNDTRGHEAGDALLCTVAMAMAAELRPSDMLARTGGDEFVAVLTNCDQAAAARLGLRLKRAVATASFAFGSASISVGIAAGRPEDRPVDVFRFADRALYAAKTRRPLLAAIPPA